MIRPRDNPFRVERLCSLGFRPQGFTWEGLLERLGKLDYEAAIVGPDGTGKSTLLRELGRRLEAGGHRIRTIALTDGRRELPRGFELELARQLDSSEVILFDGGDHLGPWAWRRFRYRTRRARGLVITNHRRSRLPLLVRTRTTPELLFELATELAPELAITKDDCEQLLTATRGNVREALFALYDRSSC
jgi:hypothetical protein